MLRKTINFIVNMKAKYFEKDTLAYDEVALDPRDYEMA
jgi:hypothetical protein